MMSVGHRTGLFDTMHTMPPSKSAEIAVRAGLNERYVREWLGAMVTSGIVQYKKEDNAYHLPKEHAAFLTRAGGADNIATLTQFFSLLGTVEDQIVDCFQNGGGVPYSAYPRFQTMMADDSGQTVVPALFDQILPLVPGIMERLEKGIDVLDVGCGCGKTLIQMAQRFKGSRFTGYDISEEGISYGNKEAKKIGLTNIRLLQQDAAIFQEKEAYDLVTTFDAIHDQAYPEIVLKNIQKAMRPGGVYLMQDIDMHTSVGDNLENPIATLIYTISCMHCMTVSLAAGGAGLGAAWVIEQAQEMLKEAGFTSIEIKRLSHDIQNCFYILKK